MVRVGRNSHIWVLHTQLLSLQTEKEARARFFLLLEGMLQKGKLQGRLWYNARNKNYSLLMLAL